MNLSIKIIIIYCSKAKYQYRATKYLDNKNMCKKSVKASANNNFVNM